MDVQRQCAINEWVVEQFRIDATWGKVGDLFDAVSGNLRNSG